MKTLIVLVMALWAGGISCLAQTSQDTTVVVNHAKKVTIEKRLNSMSVKIEGTVENPAYFYSQTMVVDSTAAVITTEKNADWDFTIPFINKKNKKNKTRRYYMTECNTSLGIGMVNAVNAPADLNIDMGASYEFSVDNLLKCRYNLIPTTSVSLGAGLNWKNYRMTGRTRFIQEGSNVVLGEYPEGADIKFSRLKIFSITIPLMINQAIGKNALLSVGPVININTHGSLKTRYTLNGEKVKEKSNDIHQNRTTVDFMAKLRIKDLGFYAKYSPTDVLHTEFGPKFNSFSTGVCWFLDFG